MGRHRVLPITVEKADKVSGLILFAPVPPANMELRDVPTPLMMLWTKDDPIVAFEESIQEYGQALDGRRGATHIKVVESGGHHMDSTVADEEVRESMKQFVAAALLLHMENTTDKPKTNSARRLSAVLPSFLQPKSQEEVWGLEDMKRLSEDLPAWLSTGMKGDSE